MVNLSKILIIFLVCSTIFTSGCSINDLSSQDIQKISENIIKCDAPYIRHGAECCLDKNSNNICDSDETDSKNNENTATDNNEDSDDTDFNNNENTDSDDNEVIPTSNSGIDTLSALIFAGKNLQDIKNTPTDELIKSNADSNTDSDMDGIPDDIEISGELGYETNPNKADTDGDGLSDLREYWWICNPTKTDTNDDGISDGDSVNSKEAYPYKIAISKKNILGSYDLDGDGIPTAAEKYDLGLNYKVYSTDGDRYGDGQEYFGIDSTTGLDEGSLPSYVKADPYNPATPDIAIIIKDYELVYSKKVTEGEEEETKEFTKKSSTQTFSQGVTLTIGAKASTSVKASLNPFNAGAEVKTEAYAGIESKTSFTFKGERTSGSESIDSITKKTETDYSDTKIRLWLDVENIGDDILTSKVEEVIVNCYIGNDKKPFTSKELDISLTNLKVGDTVSLALTEIKLEYDEFNRIDSGEGLTIALEHYSFGEDQIYLENAKASSIKVSVDDLETLKQSFLMPYEGMTVKSALNELGYIYEFADNRIISFNGKEEHIADKPYVLWDFLITRYSGEEIELAENIEDTLIYAGDFIVIKYRSDKDGDGLSDEDEARFGTDETSIDTDGDGFTDGESFKDYIGELTLGTSPLYRDSDFDFAPDNLEIKKGTDPTDGTSYPEMAFLFDKTGCIGDEPIEVVGKKDLYKTFNNKVSSLYVPPGMAAILYDKANYETEKYYDNTVVFGRVNNLDYFNNKASSIEVVKIEDLPYVLMIGKEGTKEHLSKYFDSCSDCRDDVCFILNIENDKEKEAGSYFCDTTKDGGYSYFYRVSKFNQKTISYGRWSFEPSTQGWYHIKNKKSSELREDYDICLLTNIEKPKAEEVRGYQCNNNENEFYLNWNIVPYDDGWVNLVNQGSSMDRGTNVCLWMDADVDWVKELQGYNCGSVDDKDKIKWRFAID